MKVNILVGDPLEMVPAELILQRKNGKWIGTDRGASRLLRWGIKPVLAIGDFDFVTGEELRGLEGKITRIKACLPEKDYTDMQLGVKFAIQEQVDEIEISGAAGGHLDHLLVNLFLPLQSEFKPYLTKIKTIDCQNVASYYLPGDYTIPRLPHKKYLVFVNLTPVRGLTLKDEKYPLQNWSSQILLPWANNEFTAEENHFSFESEIISVIQCNDQLK